MVVDSGEVVEFELCSLGTESFKEGNLVVVEIRLLEDLKIPLALLCMSQQVVNVAGNGRLS